MEKRQASGMRYFDAFVILGIVIFAVIVFGIEHIFGIESKEDKGSPLTPSLLMLCDKYVKEDPECKNPDNVSNVTVNKLISECKCNNLDTKRCIQSCCFYVCSGD